MKTENEKSTENIEKCETDIKLENLKSIIQSIGSIAELNEKLGRGRRDPYLYSIIRGDKNPSGAVRTLGIRLCRDIEKALNLPPGYMSEDHTSAATIGRDVFKPISEDGYCAIKLLEPIPNSEKKHMYLDASGMAENFPGRPADDFRGAIMFTDDMAPEFIPGDRVLVDITATTPEPGFLVLDTGARLILRRCRSALDGSLRISAESMPGESMPLDTSRHKIIGRVVYHWRGRKL